MKKSKSYSKKFDELKRELTNSSLDRIKTGIPGFDNIINGGFIKNSLNLVSGGPGTGKSIFCMQYLLNGAKEFGEKGLYISFEEKEEELKADVEGLGMDFSEVNDKVKFLYHPIWPNDITKFPNILKEEILLFQPQRLVIDSLSAIGLPMQDDYERRKQIFRVRDTLKTAGVTSLLTSEAPQDGSMGDNAIGRMSRFDIEEFICDSVTVLHYAGIGGEGDRAVRVVKMRRTDHVKGPVPMEIEQGGMKILKSKY